MSRYINCPVLTVAGRSVAGRNVAMPKCYNKRLSIGCEHFLLYKVFPRIILWDVTMGRPRLKFLGTSYPQSPYTCTSPPMSETQKGRQLQQRPSYFSPLYASYYIQDEKGSSRKSWESRPKEPNEPCRYVGLGLGLSL